MEQPGDPLPQARLVTAGTPDIAMSPTSSVRSRTRSDQRPVPLLLMILLLLSAGRGAVLLARRLAAARRPCDTPGLRADAADHFRTSW